MGCDGMWMRHVKIIAVQDIVQVALVYLYLSVFHYK